MHILVVGINYRTAPVGVREKFAFAEQELPDALKMLKQTNSILECAIVATCNRTEIYVVVDRLHLCGHFIRGFIESWFHIPRTEFTSHLYMYEDDDAIKHLFRVTCGLDSMVLGETQILGQVRSAFLLAQKQKTTGTLFNMLFKQAVTLAKKAHSETGINDNAASVSYAAVELGKQIFGNFRHKTVLIIGAGKMSELTVKHLYANGADQVIVINRTYKRAVELAGKFEGVARPAEELPNILHDVDVVISSTGAVDYVLTREQVQKVMKKRKSRSLFMIDIAVPRNLDPAILELANVFLYDIDDLQCIVESNLEQRRREAAKIEEMIQTEVDVFQQWYKTLGLSPVIRALQEKAAIIHEETMDSLLRKLPDLNGHEIKVIRKLTKSIANQMIHDPILRMKEMAVERRGEEAMDLFTNFFALEELLAERKKAEQSARSQEKQRSSAETDEISRSFDPRELLARL